MVLDSFSELIWLCMKVYFYILLHFVLFFLNPWYCFDYWSFIFIVNSEVIGSIHISILLCCLRFLEIKGKIVCEYVQLHVEVTGQLLGVVLPPAFCSHQTCTADFYPKNRLSSPLHFSIQYYSGFLGFLKVLYEF